MKVLQIMAAVLLLLGLCACAAQSPEGAVEEGEPLEITSFDFTHTGSSTAECFQYSAAREEEHTRLYTEGLYSGGLIVDTIIDEPVLEQLGAMAGRYRLDLWDGFDKSDWRVMDGSGFSLSITLADGTTISAHGSNCFPDRYGDAEREIRALFEKLIERYGGTDADIQE